MANSIHGTVSKITEVSTKSGLRKVIGRILTEQGSVTVKAFGAECRLLQAVEGRACTLYGRSEPCKKEPGTYEFIVNRASLDSPDSTIHAKSSTEPDLSYRNKDYYREASPKNRKYIDYHMAYFRGEKPEAQTPTAPDPHATGESPFYRQPEAEDTTQRKGVI